jgi:hypothetical protein
VREGAYPLRRSLQNRPQRREVGLDAALDEASRERTRDRRQTGQLDLGQERDARSAIGRLEPVAIGEGVGPLVVLIAKALGESCALTSSSLIAPPLGSCRRTTSSR